MFSCFVIRIPLNFSAFCFLLCMSVLYMIILLLSIIVTIINIKYFKSSNIWLKCNAKGWFYTISENLTVNWSFSCASSIILYEFSIYPPNQELLCRGWFLPPNTYDCGSFVVNGTAVVGKEQNNPYNCWKSTQKEEVEQQLEGTMHEKPFLNSVVSFCNTALLLISNFFSTPLAKQKEAWYNMTRRTEMVLVYGACRELFE